MAEYNDPFADAPADEAQAAPAAPNSGPWEETAPAPAPAAAPAAKPAPIVVGSEGGKVTVTLKGGTSFDKPWVVIHAEDIPDALDNLKHPSIKELLFAAQKAGQFFVGQGSGAAAPGPQNGNQGAVQPQQLPTGQPQGSTERPSDVPAQYCDHGEMVWKSGFSKKNGKAWKAHMCRAPQGAVQCEPKFVR